MRRSLPKKNIPENETTDYNETEEKQCKKRIVQYRDGRPSNDLEWLV